MDERTNLKYHINKSKNSITHLLRIKVEIKGKIKLLFYWQPCQNHMRQVATLSIRKTIIDYEWGVNNSF